MFHFCEKVKRDYYNNPSEKNIYVNRKFWELVKPLLSNKIASKIIKTDQANAKVFNNFFSNIIKNLGIPQYNQIDPICQHKKDPVIKAIIKYRNHPSIIASK